MLDLFSRLRRLAGRPFLTAKTVAVFFCVPFICAQANGEITYSGTVTPIPPAGSDTWSLSDRTTVLVGGSSRSALTISNATVTAGYIIRVGQTDNETSTMSVTNGTLSVGFNFFVAEGASRTGVVEFNNSTITANSQIYLGYSRGSTASMYVTNSTLSVGSRVAMGNFGGTALLELRGSTMSAASIDGGFDYGQTSVLRVVDSTLSTTGNVTSSGGALCVYLTSGTATIGGAVLIGTGSQQSALVVSNKMSDVSIGQTLSIGANGKLQFDIDASLLATGDPIIDAGAFLFSELGQYVVTLENLDSVLSDTQILLLGSSQTVSQAVKDIAWQIEGLPDGYDITTEWIGDNLYLNIQIPEPAVASAVLGMLSLVAVLRRRK